MTDPAVVATHVWPSGALTPVACPELVLDWGGRVGDRHHGQTMRSDGRQSTAFTKGTEIRNHRQVCLVDAAELAEIAQALGSENDPCILSGAMVAQVQGTTPQSFAKAAIHLRGVTGWVEHPGVVRAGDGIRILTP